MPPPADLETLQYKLKKRGFRQDDMFLHVCPTCAEKAVVIYAISARTGGRDIQLCMACGEARSWRAGQGMDERVQDTEFDLRAFLK